MSWLTLSRTTLTAAILGVGVALLGQVPASAQTASDVDPLADFQTDDDGSELFGGDGATSSGVFGLIHRLQLSNNTNLADFHEQRNEDIQSEAVTFRELQMQRIEQQNIENNVESVE
jgi:hypothetical protein